MNSKDKVLAISEYLGCNGEELWSEVSQLIQDERKEAYKEGYMDSHKIQMEITNKVAKEQMKIVAALTNKED